MSSTLCDNSAEILTVSSDKILSKKSLVKPKNFWFKELSLEERTMGPCNNGHAEEHVLATYKRTFVFESSANFMKANT